MKKKIVLISIIVIILGFLAATAYLITNRQSIFSQATGTPACPSGTQLLFTSSTNLRAGSSVALAGVITNISGGSMETRNSIPLVANVSTFKITFPTQVVLDSAIIYDNDHTAWTINGVSLPTTPNNTWGPLFRLNLTTNLIDFNGHGDSTHINICVKSSPSPSNTPIPSHTRTPTPRITNTPTLTPTNSPTPEPTNTPTPTPTKTPTPTYPPLTPTPTSCPLPNAVTDVKVTCSICKP